MHETCVRYQTYISERALGHQASRKAEAISIGLACAYVAIGSVRSLIQTSVNVVLARF
jgi:hypothetical protein